MADGAICLPGCPTIKNNLHRAIIRAMMNAFPFRHDPMIELIQLMVRLVRSMYASSITFMRNQRDIITLSHP